MFGDALPMMAPFILRAPVSIRIPWKRLFKGLQESGKGYTVWGQPAVGGAPCRMQARFRSIYRGEGTAMDVRRTRAGGFPPSRE